MLSTQISTLSLLLTFLLLVLPGTSLADPPLSEGQRVAVFHGPRAPVASLGGHIGPARPGLRPAPREEDHFSDIDQVSATVWTLEQGLVDDYSGDLERLERLARARRHRNLQGEIDGYYIDRIRRNNPLYDAGIRNGDVVHAVNGDPTRNTIQVLRTFYKHRRAKVFHVELTRRGGQQLTLTYIVI